MDTLSFIASIAIVASIVAGILCALYGIVLECVERGSHFVVLWCAIGLVIASPGVLAITGIWQTLPPPLQWAWFAVLAAFFAYETIFFVLASRHFNDGGTPSLDYLVVLGACVLKDGRPSDSFARRLETARAYLADNPQTLCIACGGQGSDEPASEARCAAEYLYARGIERNRVVLEDTSCSTTESLCNVANMINDPLARVGVVTTGYHLFRTLAIARRVGIAYAVGISAGIPEWFLLGHLVRESVAFAKDML